MSKMNGARAGLEKPLSIRISPKQRMLIEEEAMKEHDREFTDMIRILLAEALSFRKAREKFSIRDFS